MAKLFILTAAPAYVQDAQLVPAVEIPATGFPVKVQAIGATSSNTELTGGQPRSAGGPTYRLVTVIADANCHIEIGSSAVAATTNSLLLPAGVYFSFSVLVPSPAAPVHVAVIAA